VNRVKAAFFSFTPPAPPDDDGSYLRWHLLDHMPEQFQLPGIVHAVRWTAEGLPAGARVAGSLDVGGVVNYLVGDPVQQTHDDFMSLGRRLAELGRYPVARPSLGLRMPALLRAYSAPAALVSPEVVPFRPHRGAVVVVEEPVVADDGGSSSWLLWLHRTHHQEVLSVPGVAGVWFYGSTSTWTLHRNCLGDPAYVTVVYLDDDVVATSAALAPLLEGRWAEGSPVRPLFAGPLRSMVSWEAWPA